MRANSIRTMVVTISAIVAGVANGGIVVFDNMPGNAFQTGSGFTLSSGQPIGSDLDQGEGFIPSDSGFLTDLYVPIGLVVGVNQIDLWVMSDLAGSPGSILETITVVGAMGPFGGNNVVHAVANGTTFLDETKQYWVIASTVGDSWAAWCQNSIGDIGPHAFYTNGGAPQISNNTRGAMRVEVVPEPATLALIGAAVMFIRRRR